MLSPATVTSFHFVQIPILIPSPAPSTAPPDTTQPSSLSLFTTPQWNLHASVFDPTAIRIDGNDLHIVSGTHDIFSHPCHIDSGVWRFTCRLVSTDPAQSLRSFDLLPFSLYFLFAHSSLLYQYILILSVFLSLLLYSYLLSFFLTFPSLPIFFSLLSSPLFSLLLLPTQSSVSSQLVTRSDLNTLS